MVSSVTTNAITVEKIRTTTTTTTGIRPTISATTAITTRIEETVKRAHRHSPNRLIHHALLTNLMLFCFSPYMLYAGYDNLNPNYEAMRDRFQRGKCLKQAFE